MLKISAVALLLVACAVSEAQQPASVFSDYVHGTIDVVVSTRAGFVLATDSRATLGAGLHTDDAQKAFTVGDHAAVVIAGLVGSEIGMEGFRLRDAIALHLLNLDTRVRAGQDAATASHIALTFRDALDHVAGLLTPGTFSVPTLVGVMSVVSIAPDGQSEWATAYFPLDHVSSNGELFYTAGNPTFSTRPMLIGRRFDVEALGYPSIVQQLLGADRSGHAPGSTTAIMRKYYYRKRLGLLDAYTLNEATELAKFLVSTTIANAPDSAGVGGPVDVMTLSRNGTKWLSKKQNSAPPIVPTGLRFIGGGIKGGSTQPIDGLLCVRCKLENLRMTFSGQADAELLGPVIVAPCKLTILPGAAQKMPDVVHRLKIALANKCDVEE